MKNEKQTTLALALPRFLLLISPTMHNKNNARLQHATRGNGKRPVVCGLCLCSMFIYMVYGVYSLWFVVVVWWI
jgi:hypothetical protein